ncbi:MAG: hypothetical protein U1E34_02480 [Amaricoccus sp.]
MAARSAHPAIGGVGLIVACFLVSAALRLSESGLALAEEMESAAPAQSADASGDAGQLMKALRDREAQLNAEETRLADRAQTLNVAEAKLAEQLAAYEKAQKQLQDTLASADKAAEKDIDRMTTVYENMKPADAARILDRMDVNFAAGLMARMRPEIAANVLAAMNADSAYAVTLTVASRNSKVPTK